MNMFVISRTETAHTSSAPTTTTSPTVACDIEARVCAPGAEFCLQAKFETSSRRIALFGPSGSGKSLTLMALAGLLKLRTGRIEVRGRTFFDAATGLNVPARRRNVGIVFQDYALFPHLTVADNVAFGLSGRPKAERRDRALVQLFTASSTAPPAASIRLRSWT